jgi:hypothetical protein
MQNNREVSPARTVFQLSTLVLLVLVALNYQYLLDQYALATFQPASNMSAIISRMGLTKQAKAVMYRSHPRVDDKATFNADCQTKPHELELGCYFRNNIYVLRIDNSSLSPEMDVVSAHELLHAEWDRMSALQRKTLGAQLEQEYQTLSDPSLKQRMSEYAQTEPGQQDNELHSIIGTEIEKLPPDLERHYAQYFMNREAIVSAHTAYEQVFSQQGAQLQSQLSQIRSEKAALANINAEMTRLRDSGQVEAYNALVPRQNGLVDDINARILRYQQGVNDYNSLSKSLDSQAITDTETSAH